MVLAAQRCPSPRVSGQAQAGVRLRPGPACSGVPRCSLLVSWCWGLPERSCPRSPPASPALGPSGHLVLPRAESPRGSGTQGHAHPTLLGSERGLQPRRGKPRGPSARVPGCCVPVDPDMPSRGGPPVSMLTRSVARLRPLCPLWLGPAVSGSASLSAVTGASRLVQALPHPTGSHRFSEVLGTLFQKPELPGSALWLLGSRDRWFQSAVCPCDREL